MGVACKFNGRFMSCMYYSDLRLMGGHLSIQKLHRNVSFKIGKLRVTYKSVFTTGVQDFIDEIRDSIYSKNGYITGIYSQAYRTIVLNIESSSHS